MDPPLIGEGSFSTASPSLSEIWPFNSGGDSGGMLGLRMVGAAGYGSGLIDALVNNNGGGGLINRDGSIEESTVTEQSGSFGGSGRKRRENCSGDESSKLVSSTSSANGLVYSLYFCSFFLTLLFSCSKCSRRGLLSFFGKSPSCLVVILM